MGRVGGEPLLLGVVRLETRKHGVEGVGELTELVVAACQLDPVGERPVPGETGGLRDARERGQHPAGEKPPAHQAEHEQERQHGGRSRREGIEEVGPVRNGRTGTDDHAVGHVPQQEQPDHGEQQRTGNHEERRVAEGELQANAQTGRLAMVPPTRGVALGVDAIADAWHGGDDPGFAEAFAQG